MADQVPEWMQALYPQNAPASTNLEQMGIGVNPAIRTDATLPPVSYSDLQAMGSPLAQPAGGHIPLVPASGALSSVLKGLSKAGAPALRYLEGELMGASPATTNPTAQLGRGQTFEGTASRVNANRLPSPKGRVNSKGRQAQSEDSMLDFLAELFKRTGGQKPPGGGSGGGAGRTAGGGGAPAGPSPLEAAGMRADSRLGSYRAPKESVSLAPETPLRGLLTFLGVLPGGEGNAEPTSTPLNTPDSNNFFAELGAGAGGIPDFSLPAPITTEQESLPGVGWDEAPSVNYDRVAEMLSGLKPEKSEDRGFLEDLAGWVGPALAFGTLLGPAGLLLGGLIGEGGRQTRNSQREDAYDESVRRWKTDLAEKLMQLQEGKREQFLETAKGLRQEALGDATFETSQEEADQSRTEFRDTRILQEIRAKQALAELQRSQRAQQLQTMMLGNGTGIDNHELLTQFIKLNPQLLGVLGQMPAFAAWQGTAGQKQPGMQLEADANLSLLLQQLEANPQYAPILQKLKQQMAMSNFLTQ